MVLTNAFTPRKTSVFPDVIYDKDIVEYVRKEKVTDLNPDDPSEFVKEEIVVEKSRVDRKAFIESFSDEVGIQNILKKVAMTNDPSYLNQINRSAMPIDQNDPEKREVIQDFTAIQGEAAAMALGDKAKALFAALPSDLVAGRSYEEFISTVNQSQIDAYLASIQKKGDE